MKIALVHDWFNEAGGAEKVVREILHCYPEADVFCLFDFFDDTKREHYLYGKKTRTGMIQHIPGVRQLYRIFFPLFPFAIEHLPLKEYDIILSSSSCVAKGLIKQPHQLHISYCHSPARYAWDLKEEYLSATKTLAGRAILRYFFDRLRKWDLRSSDRADYFIANSCFVRDRIKKYFNREASVIYPPVNVEMHDCTHKRGNNYFALSRLVTYKRVDLLIDAFRKMPDLTLEIGGDGPLNKELQKAAPPNVHFLGYIDEETKRRKFTEAKAFVAAAVEDFGITVVEAQSFCTPVIVPRTGGYLETVNDNTGVFFKERTVQDIVASVKDFDKSEHIFKKEHFCANIQRFKTSRFHNEFRSLVDEKIITHYDGKKI